MISLGLPVLYQRVEKISFSDLSSQQRLVLLLLEQSDLLVLLGTSGVFLGLDYKEIVP